MRPLTQPQKDLRDELRRKVPGITIDELINAINQATIANPDKFAPTTIDIQQPKQQPQTILGGVRERLGERLQERAGKAEEARLAGERGEQTAFETGLQQIGQAGAFIGEDLPAEFITPVISRGIEEIQKLPDVVKEQLVRSIVPAPIRALKSAAEAAIEAIPEETRQQVVSALEQGAEAFQKFQEENPRIMRNIEAVGGITSLPLTGAAAQTATRLGLRGVKKIGGELLEAGTEQVAKAQARKFVKRAEKELKSIIDELTPNFNLAEQKKAIEEGRVVRPKVGVIRKTLFGTPPDKIEASQSVIDAAETVQRRLPRASKLDRLEIANFAKEEIANISNDLRPKLEVIEVADESLEKAQEAVKKLAIKRADDTILSQPDLRRVVLKEEKRFRDIVSDLQAASLNDVWNARKLYDEAIAAMPSGKKIKVGQNLTERQQVVRDIWLENRLILNDMINDVSFGLGEESKNAFRDMNNLYRARENIISNPRIKLGKEKGIVNPGTALGVAASLVGINWIF